MKAGNKVWPSFDLKKSILFLPRSAASERGGNLWRTDSTLSILQSQRRTQRMQILAQPSEARRPLQLHTALITEELMWRGQRTMEEGWGTLMKSKRLSQRTRFP